MYDGRTMFWSPEHLHSVNEVEDREDLIGHSVVRPGEVVELDHFVCLVSLQEGEGSRVGQGSKQVYRRNTTESAQARRSTNRDCSTAACPGDSHACVVLPACTAHVSTYAILMVKGILSRCS